MRTAVVGHVEWVEMVRVEHPPSAGEIVHAEPWWIGPGGGGPDAAVQLAKLSGEATLFTALGDDELGHRTVEELTAMGVMVESSVRQVPSRRAFVHIDLEGERAITVIGERLGPHGRDQLPWDKLETVDGVYFTAGDMDALKMARRARVLVATARAMQVLRGSGVELDALVASANDPSETYEPGALDPPPGLIVLTEGSRGGTFQERDGPLRRYSPVPIPEIVDRYGAGDAFAAGLTYGLAAEMPVETAVDLASRCGAAVLGGRGPYEGQLTN